MARGKLGAGLLAWVVLTATGVGSAYADRAPVPQSGTNKRLAFVFYYPWFTGSPNYYHWTLAGSAVDPTNIDSASYPTLNPYNSTSSVVLNQHMAWIKQAGFDVVILSWWGQGSREDN